MTRNMFCIYPGEGVWSSTILLKINPSLINKLLNPIYVQQSVYIHSQFLLHALYYK